MKLVSFLEFAQISCNEPLKKISDKTRPTQLTTEANLYPPERQLTKASEPLFDLEAGPKVKSDHIRIFPAHDILQVGFTLQTSRIDYK